MTTQWREEADVVVVGYGGAGAVTAVAAHDSGVKVLILEKQHGDTPTRTNHTPSTRMCGGSWWTPKNAENAALYIESMAKATNETVDKERREMIGTFARHLIDNTAWAQSIGVSLGSAESMVFSGRRAALTMEEKRQVAAGNMATADFPNLPGSDQGFSAFAKVTGQYRSGAALFKYLSEAVHKRNIPVMWETPAVHLVMRDGEVLGVLANRGGKEIAIKANRAVVLTCGGFEFNTWMKENYLRVNPVHFYGCPSCTGDGINMTMEVGAAFWHMNNASWRAVMKFPELPVAMGTRNHETSVFVDKLGKRFASERYKAHAFAYELTNYDCHLLTYPKVPFYMVFDERRRSDDRLASYHGVCNPPGGIMGDIYYDWSKDNQPELDRGWIMKASTIEELAGKIVADPDDAGLMNASVLRATIKRYNQLCRKGEDTDFHKDKQWLWPVENPPYYAIKLWPGGPNTQGGPKRNSRGQVLRVNNSPIPRLYSAGELGSFWGMIYQGGGNIAECIAFGRICGANASSEKPWK